MEYGNEIENILKKDDELNIEKNENMDIDDFNETTNNNAKINSINKDKKEENLNSKNFIVNLNDKYGFNKYYNFFNEIEFNNEKKYLIIKKINYFKSSTDYMDIRYFSFINFNKKSNQKKVIKCVIEKLK